MENEKILSQSEVEWKVFESQAQQERNIWIYVGATFFFVAWIFGMIFGILGGAATYFLIKNNIDKSRQSFRNYIYAHATVLPDEEYARRMGENQESE